MKNWIRQGDRVEGFPTIHIVSDGAGTTAVTAARAAAANYSVTNPTIELLPDVSDAEMVTRELTEHLEHHRKYYGVEPFILFYTSAGKEISAAIDKFGEDNEEVIVVDILRAPTQALVQATGIVPHAKAGALRALNDTYFKRIEAIEFTIAHDDGCMPEELTVADIVLIGVSRTSKTPTSIYLSQQGYKVANVPLDPLTEPPSQLFDVEPSRIFGLMTVPEVLVDIRRRRLGEAGNIASSYADYEQVCRDLDKARALMRKLGCIVVRTDNRAIEETSQEILRYFTNLHPNEHFSAKTTPVSRISASEGA